MHHLLRKMRTFLKFRIALLVFGFGLGAKVVAQPWQGDFSNCPEHFAGGLPPVVYVQTADAARTLCLDGFAILYSTQSKTAVYAAERITPRSLADAKKIKRTGRFYEEARLPSAHRARLADYKGSGFDRGHLFPAGNASTPESMAQSFSLANMVPQDPTNNRGPWAKSVETAVRKYVERSRREVFVLTGPIYEESIRTIGSSKVWVPSKLFKFVYDPEANKAWGYVLENNESAKVKGVLPYEEMVRATGIEFLPLKQF